MGVLKRKREEEDEGNNETNGIKQQYTKKARDLARHMLLVQGTGRPAKKKELCDAAGVDTSHVGPVMNEANRFLRSQFGMVLVTLKEASDKSSQARDEFVLVSKVKRHRTLLAKLYPAQQRKDYGLLLLVIAMIVLKEDVVDFDEIYQGYTRSLLHLHEGTDEEVELDESGAARVKDELRKSLARLESMRGFVTEMVKDPSTDEKVKQYRTGPYSHVIVDVPTLRTLIMRFHYPQDRELLKTPEGEEKYKLVRGIIRKRIADSGFRETL